MFAALARMAPFMERVKDSNFFRVKQKKSCQSRRIRLQKAIVAKNRYNQLIPLPDGTLDRSGGFMKSRGHAIRNILPVEESSWSAAASVAAKIHIKGNIW
jgi:hypothetical protein